MSNRIQLADDGTLDTVLRCSECGEEFRFNYENWPDPAETGIAPEDDYQAFIDGCIEDTEMHHVCNDEDN